MAEGCTRRGGWGALGVSWEAEGTKNRNHREQEGFCRILTLRQDIFYPSRGPWKGTAPSDSNRSGPC